MLRKRYIAIIMVPFIVGVINFFPANIALQIIAPKNTIINGINGTIWNGNASEAQNKSIYIRDLKWNIRLSNLLLGQLSYNISMYPFNGYLNTQITRNIDSTYELSDLEGSINKGVLPAIAPYLGLDAQIDYAVKQALLTKNIPIKIDGDIKIRDLKILGLSTQSLGNYAIRFNPTIGKVIGSIEGENALLDVAGTVELDSNGNYLILGLVAPNTFTPIEIVNLMNFLGTPNDKNQREFRFEGKL
ncbi:type II secretion system protein N [Woeseiaceae bacterium]|jgi:general secretion pathway protein N|nr:type II secretion system protein N [Woeseiaceae bacterium]